MLQRSVLGVLVAVGLCLPMVSAGAAEKADATVQFNGGSAAAGVGVSWGAGVLQYKGRAYPFKVTGLSIGAVGLSQASASGEVHNLKKLEDFDGNYVAVGAGLTVAGGGGVATMKNQNGVTMTVKATTRGAKVVVGGSGVSVEIIK